MNDHRLDLMLWAHGSWTCSIWQDLYDSGYPSHENDWTGRLTYSASPAYSIDFNSSSVDHFLSLSSEVLPGVLLNSLHLSLSPSDQMHLLLQFSLYFTHQYKSHFGDGLWTSCDHRLLRFCIFSCPLIQSIFSSWLEQDILNRSLFMNENVLRPSIRL